MGQPPPNSFAGLLVSKVDNGRNIRSCAKYDALNRETSLSYSNGDPAVTTTYDQSGCLDLSSCANIGHRTSVTDAAGSESWSYQVDATNHRGVHENQRTTSGVTKSTTYYLDLSGNVTSITYPTGRIVNYTYNAANRAMTAQDSANGITYATAPSTPLSGCPASAVCYTPQGSIYSMSLGVTSSFTGLNISETFNNRLQPNETKASSTAGNALDISYNFVDPVSGHNAGHVYGITNNLNSSRSQSLTYDQLNRVLSAGTTATTGSYCWGYQFSYDAWGNLLSQAGWTPTYNACTESTMGGVTADGNNHITGLSYDASGNTLSDGNFSYSWNAESQMKTAAGVTYSYDGDGRRAAKVGSKLYWYGSGGEILAETNSSGTATAEYVFFGGKRIALLPAGSNAQYYVEDFLGTSRVVTQNNGAVCYDADFPPYGQERAYTNSCTQNAYKFQGKERDAETQNDEFGARNYSWRFGRWLSADWSSVPVPVPYANLTNPQTLNLYAMVADDPESFADLDGHIALDNDRADFNTSFDAVSCAGHAESCESAAESAAIQKEAQATEAKAQAQSNTSSEEAAVAYAAKTNGTVAEHEAVVSVIENRASSGDKQYVDKGKDVNVDNVVNHNGGFAEVKSTQYQDYLQGRAANPGAANAGTAVEDVHKNGPTTNATFYIANPKGTHPRKSQVRSLGSVKPAKPSKVGGVYLYVPRHPHPSPDQ